MNKWKVAAYLRLSIDDGDKIESNSITNQKEIINSYIKNESDLIIKNYYVDDGYSGTSFDRPDFKKMILDVERDKVNTIIVKDLSRFGRNYIEVGRYIEEFFPMHNIRFIAINDNIDSYKDPKSINSIIVPFKNLMNDEYARDISNKVRSVLNTKRENGEFIGSFAPYGYIKDTRNKHKFIIDDVSAKIVKKIFYMVLNGKSRTEVAAELNDLNISPPAVYKMKKFQINNKVGSNMYKWDKKKIDAILTNPTYTGDLIQGKVQRISHKVHKVRKVEKENWYVVPNHHKAIISKEDFNQVRDILYNRDTRENKNNNLNIFSGHLKCEDCECNLSSFKSNERIYYYCTSYMRHKKCTSHSISENKLRKIVLDIINKQVEIMIDLEEKIKLVSQKENINYDLEILKSKLIDVEENLSKLYFLRNELKKDYTNNFISMKDFEEYDSEYESKIKQLLENKKIIEYKIDTIDNTNYKQNNILDKYNSKIQELNKVIIDDLIDYIYISKDRQVRIIFKYRDEYKIAVDILKKYNCNINDGNFVENSYTDIPKVPVR